MLYERNIRKIIICPTCQGDGSEQEFNQRENCYLPVQCTSCNGSGKVRRIVNIKFEKL